MFISNIIPQFYEGFMKVFNRLCGIVEKKIWIYKTD